VDAWAVAGLPAYVRVGRSTEGPERCQRGIAVASVNCLSPTARGDKQTGATSLY